MFIKQLVRSVLYMVLNCSDSSRLHFYAPHILYMKLEFQIKNERPCNEESELLSRLWKHCKVLLVWHFLLKVSMFHSAAHFLSHCFPAR